MKVALSFVLRLLIDKDHFLSYLGSSVISFPDRSRVAPLSKERGIGCGTLTSKDATKSSPVSVRLTDGNATFSPGEERALFGEGKFEKKD